MMIGRSVEAYLPQHDPAPGEVRLSVRNLSSAGKFDGVSFEIKAGEIVGFAGLVGSGRSEIATAIFGLDAAAAGGVWVNGQPLKLGDIRAAKAAGVGLVPEDRKRQGLVLGMSCLNNFLLASLERLSRLGFVRRGETRRQARRLFDQLLVKAATLDTPVGTLSGGNQQKVALAKWLARDCRVLILDEPTRGVDVGAKAAIHQLIDQLAAGGMAVMLISSELPEVVNLSSRVLVMREGRLVAELPRGQATQDAVLRQMTNVATANEQAAVA
jgi:ABC-type sugar transport system ATPase subunit